ncbi:MAG: DUF6178 family protein [Kofleriaceae bacterium]
MTTTLIGSPPSARTALARLLDTPDLVATIQAMPPRALAATIAAVGLEDAGELVALATTPQLVAVFDEDLWSQAQAGDDERFEPARFQLWLEVLAEAGATFAAATLAAMPEDLLAFALQQLLVVFDIDDLRQHVEATERDPDHFDKLIDGCPHEDVGSYELFGRYTDGWDALLDVVLALDRDHSALLTRVLDRCAAASAAALDEHDLEHVLAPAEMLVADAAGERADRRAAAGYVAPADARAFLALIDQTSLAALLADDARDPITQAYFRDRARAQARRGRQTGAARLRPLAVPESTAVVPTAPPPGGLRRALGELAALDGAAHTLRLEELAYLANVLVAGGTLGRRAYRPVEAADAAIAACERGLHHLSTHTGHDLAAVLAATPADQLFRIGWKLGAA